MRYTIEQASDLGGVIRAARKAQQLRQDDAAGSVGVSLSFMVKAEAGASSVQWGKVFQILQGLGVRVSVDIPDASEDLLEAQTNKARHRAAAREFRAAERQISNDKTQTLDQASEDSATEPSLPGHPAQSEFVVRAALRLLETQSGKARAGATLKRARRVVAQAEEAKRPKGRKGTTDK
ncbi:helix-turn-helix domain-containing protein [Burkholderia oklahomensis]|nr:helix-turn-helix domain-containing protein [Burkholderia oklahomensis]MDN7676736.1 helix-turn-helix domain-containing protein [Burkholderia oklahomensis]